MSFRSLSVGENGCACRSMALRVDGSSVHWWNHFGYAPDSFFRTSEHCAIASTTAVSIDSFTIIREMPSDFSGDWEPLKGKRAFYVWARPQGSSLNETGNKLQFAESVFRIVIAKWRTVHKAIWRVS